MLGYCFGSTASLTWMSDVFSPFFPSACAFICIFFSRSRWTSSSKSQPQQATSCGTCVQGTSVQPGPSWWSYVASLNNRVQIGVLEDLPCYLAYVVELLNRLLNSSASVLVSGFLAVLRTCLQPRYLLKFRKVCSSSGGPLSLPKTMGIPSSENTRFSFGITARAWCSLHKILLQLTVSVGWAYRTHKSA